jgi:Tol biopolymer transport system component
VPLTPGSQLGPYEIAAPLGAGGMGEVYRARDPRLDRIVAIKLVPDAFAGDLERLARFEREARLLASLNHANIAVLHGLEAVDGRRFIVMECVEGESLAQRLEKGPLAVEEALDVARQVATALEAAHEGGVVHRDLKPGNIMITPAGVAKVLDFGLAKGATGSPSDTALSASPTLTFAATAGGVILGTAAYMSPEQARGKPVDRRTDIWAFGCVLYECLTGKQAFEGETVSDLIASILKGEIDWAALPTGTPPRVRELLRRCLERDPRQRLRDIGEARLTLEQPMAGGAPGASSAPSATRGLPAPLAIGAALVLAALAGFAGWAVKPAPPLPPTAWSHIVPPDGVQFQVRYGGNMALSDDGRWLATLATDSSRTVRILVRDFETGGTRLLTGSEDANYPFWSPDGKSLGAFKDGRLIRFDVESGATTVVAAAPEGRGGTWSRQDLIVFAPNASGGLSAVQASGGEVSVLVPDSLNRGYRFPHFLPDGRHFVCAFFDSAGTALEIRSVAGGEPRRLALGPGLTGNAYYANGRLFYWQERALRSRAFDPGRMELSGNVATVASNVAAGGPRARSDIAVAASGAIIYRPALGTGSDQVVVRSRAGQVLSRIEFDDSIEDLGGISPDGRTLALSVRPRGAGQIDVWTHDLDRGARLRLTFAGEDDDPCWSPDGRRIAWLGPQGLRVKAASGAGTEKLMFESRVDILPSQWAPDGRTILYTGPGAQQGARGFDAVWAVNVDSGVARELAGGQAHNVRQGQISPDGRWLAYASNESRQYQVYVQDWPGLRGRWQISTRSGLAPRWRRDGRELFFLDFDGRIMGTLLEVRDSSITAGVPQVLFETQMGSHAANRSYSWDVDATGARFYTVEPRVQQVERQPMTMVRHWQLTRADR